MKKYYKRKSKGNKTERSSHLPYGKEILAQKKIHVELKGHYEQ
jgi:hypothetical protein